MWALFMIRNGKNKDLLIWTYRPSGSPSRRSVHSPSRFRCDHLCCSGHPAWLLGTSLSSPEGFEQASAIRAASSSNLSCGASLPLWRITRRRYSPHDDGFWLSGRNIRRGKRSAKISFVITVVLSLLAESSYGKQRLRIRTQWRT